MAKLRRSGGHAAKVRRARVEALEPRILLSADFPGAETLLAPEPAHVLELPAPTPDPSAAGIEQDARRRELVFIDPRVEGAEELVADLREGAEAGRQIEVVFLDAERDGVAQIGGLLSVRDEPVDAIHVVSHGTDSGFQLGATWLSSDNVADHAGSLSGWGDALSDDADLLLYGCNLAAGADGQALVETLGRLTGADVAASSDATGAARLGGDWELEYAHGKVESAVAFGAQAQASWAGLLDGTAIWTDKDIDTPETSEFDGGSFGPIGSTVDVGSEFRVMAGAESPTRDEKIVVGVGQDKRLDAMVWDGASWTSSEPFGIGFVTVNDDELWGFDVAYESQSGDAIITYNAGGFGLYYSVWNGTTFSFPQEIPTPVPGEPEQMKLAASPTSDEMVLVVGNENKQTYALVWDGDAWGAGTHFANGDSSQDNTDVNVAYEQQSGHAMVVYGDASDDALYQIWDGASWSGGTITKPSGASGKVTWTDLAADPNSDRIVFGTLTHDRYVWLAVWDGDAWEPSKRATTDAPHNERLSVAVAFESQGGEALAAYADNDDDGVRYRRWNSATGWSNEQAGPDPFATAHPHVVTLDADPDSDQIMLSFTGDNEKVAFSAWNGSSFGPTTQLEADAGTQRGQPFLFLWDQDQTANTAPVLTPGTPSLTGITEDESNNVGDDVASILSGLVSDPDSGAQSGIAIHGLASANGTWQYSLDGGSVWNAVGMVDPNNALLLGATDRVRFVPDGMNGASPSFDYRAWDRTSGSPGDKVDVSMNGDPTAFSAATDTAVLTVGDVNDAPTLVPGAGPMLGPVAEDAGAPGPGDGTLVSALVDFPGGGGLDNFDDVDTGTVAGIAIYAADTTNGSWLYSTDDGASWSALGPVDADSARLLAATPGTRIYFQPDPDFAGAVPNGIRFQAWDGSAGANGGLGDPTPAGGTSAFSLAASGAGITVTAVNDAPVLDPAGAMTLTDVLQDDANPPGSSVASIVASAGGDRITDADPGALEGIAVVAVDDTDGTWEYSITGGASWLSFAAQGVSTGAVDDANAVLLEAGALVRFVPDPAYNGPGGDLTFRAWDRTAGSNGDVGVDVSMNGGSNPYSLATETATVEVLPGGSIANLVPGAQSVDEDGALVFSAANGNSLAVSDGGAGDAVLRVSLSVTNGTFTLSGLAGLSVVAGANGSASMTVVGSIGAVNAALEGAQYDPTGDYAGPAGLQIDTSLANLEGHYTFDDGGDLGNDESPGGANDGVVTGAVAGVDASPRDSVLTFDGNDFVQITGRYGDPSDVTLAAWVNMNAAIVRDEAISLGDNVVLRLDETGVGVQGFFFDGAAWQTTSSGSFIAGTGWHHVAYSFDDAADQQVIYVDGVALNATGHAASISYTQGSDTFIGRNGNAATHFFNGSMDDVRIYDRALSATEVAALAKDAPMDSDSVDITVDPVNDAPQGGLAASVSTDEDTAYAFQLTDFGFSDPVEGDGFAGVVVTTVPAAGTLTRGLDVLTGGEFVTAAEIGAGDLVFTPAGDASGAPYTTFTFQVRDDGGTARGGVDTDPTPRTMTIDVDPVNDAPAGSDGSVSTPEDTAYAFSAVDFGFSDAVDGDGFAGVIVTTIPAKGTLRDGALVLTGGEFVSAASMLANAFTYTPANGESGAAYTSFTFQVRDDGGMPNGGVDLDPSANTLTIDVTSANDAPLLNPLGPNLTGIDEDQVANAGDLVSDVVGASISDDDGDPQGIAITSFASGNGSWEYSLDGGTTWTAMPAVANANALLLRGSDQVRFVPDAMNGTTPSFVYRAWDQTSGVAGNQMDTGTGGDSSAFSTATDTASLAVASVNDAPTLVATTPSLAAMTEDDAPTLGSQVSTLLGASMSDVDAVAPEGIAVTALSAGGAGTWEFSTNGGGSWAAVGSVAGNNALLLRDVDRIRFRPNGTNGTLATFDFRAWDQSTGAAGTKANATSTGGTTAWSATADQARIDVSNLNDAPTLGAAALAPVPADTADPPGATVASLFGPTFGDVDAGASMAGIAVVANPADATTEGAWQYSSDGGAHWADVGTVADGATALAISPGTLVRFVPVPGFQGTPAGLSARALDDGFVGLFSSTLGGIEIRQLADTSTNGGTSVISGAPAALSTAVDPPAPPPDLVELPPDVEEPPGPDEPPEPEETAEGDEPDAEPEPTVAPAPETAPPDLRIAAPPAPAPSARPGFETPTPPAERRDTDFADLSPELGELERRELARQTVELRQLSFDAVRGLLDGGFDFLAQGSGLLQELDRFREEAEVSPFLDEVVLGSSAAVSAGLSIGYVVWLTRGGLLIASFASSMPAWRLIDPIPVLASLAVQGGTDRESRESLQTLVDEAGEPSEDTTHP